MTDATALLHGLEAYTTALDRHLARLRDQGAALNRAWSGLSEVYRGQGAEVFAEAFGRAQEMMTTYSSNGEAILNVLRERIEALRRFDAPDSPPV
jgi:uncharacterized protein YukE